jgi:hypothetical protein
MLLDHNGYVTNTLQSRVLISELILSIPGSDYESRTKS